MEDSIVLFASYYGGDEFKAKKIRVEDLNQRGINIKLSYLLKLKRYINGVGLPDRNVAYLMKININEAINSFHPTVLAFHYGITALLKEEEFVEAVYSIKKHNPQITCLMENLNRPEKKSSCFDGYPHLSRLCSLEFEPEHCLYEKIWS